MGQARGEQVDDRVKRDRLAQHDVRAPRPATEQAIDQEHRVTGAGVAAQHDDGRRALQGPGGLIGNVLADVDVHQRQGA
jgi:hypothetical protein